MKDISNIYFKYIPWTVPHHPCNQMSCAQICNSLEHLVHICRSVLSVALQSILSIKLSLLLLNAPLMSLRKQHLSNLHSASLNYVHIVLRPGVVAICTEGAPEVAPQSTSSSYHRCHNRTKAQ